MAHPTDLIAGRWRGKLCYLAVPVERRLPGSIPGGGHRFRLARNGGVTDASKGRYKSRSESATGKRPPEGRSPCEITPPAQPAAASGMKMGFTASRRDNGRAYVDSRKSQDDSIRDGQTKQRATTGRPDSLHSCIRRESRAATMRPASPKGLEKTITPRPVRRGQSKDGQDTGAIYARPDRFRR